MILVGPYKYHERKGVLVIISTEDTGAGRAGGGSSPQLFMQKSSDLHPPPVFCQAGALILVLDPNPLAYIWLAFPGGPCTFQTIIYSGATDWFGVLGFNASVTARVISRRERATDWGQWLREGHSSPPPPFNVKTWPGGSWRPRPPVPLPLLEQFNLGLGTAW